MVEQAAEKLFHKEGPMDAKDLDWAIEVLTQGTERSSRSIEEDGGKWQKATKTSVCLLTI